MSYPRQVLAGRVYAMMRRTSERRFFLRPDRFITQAFLFILGLALRQFGIQLLACCVMSNHWHAVIWDPHGKLPRFAAKVHRLVALVTNVFRGRWENMWSSEKYSAIPLHTLDDVIREIVYTVTNPVAAGRVKHPDEWPGLLLSPHHGLSKEYSSSKPTRYFSKKNRRIPTWTKVMLSKPVHASHLSDEEYVALVTAAIEAEVAKIRAEKAAEGRAFAGVAAVMAVDPSAPATSREQKRALNPRVIARAKRLRVLLLADRESFVGLYCAARDEWRGGNRDAIFPAGTYWMAHFFGVKVAAAPQAVTA
ncbi:MAG: hypothetical protein KC561_01090 [Myxococcales bacterium]|nr:hypothetical protein [Myxococcales bacterium]